MKYTIVILGQIPPLTVRDDRPHWLLSCEISPYIIHSSLNWTDWMLR
jgi:hypothetical protein